jgi:orotidine-5'-phosphate decarboxylase
MNWKERFEERDSALCVGLDPDPARLPEGVGLAEFLESVVEATAEFAACFKPNVAFFERFGPAGLAALADLIASIRERGIPVLVDAKRGDIASTAEAYAQAYFGGPFDCDALTVNPSLGLDTVEPFRDAARALDRGIFLLLRTSNPGAAQFQDASEPILVDAIRDEPCYGAVVGATHPEDGARLRAALPDTLFLVPGFGAQGGADLRPFFDSSGSGALVNSSRGILYAGEGGSWAERESAIRAAAETARATIEKARRER